MYRVPSFVVIGLIIALAYIVSNTYPSGAKQESEKQPNDSTDIVEHFDLVLPDELKFNFAVSDWDITSNFSDDGSMISEGTATIDTIWCEGHVIELTRPTQIHISSDESVFDMIPTKNYGEIKMSFSPHMCRGIWVTKNQKQLLLKLKSPADKSSDK